MGEERFGGVWLVCVLPSKRGMECGACEVDKMYISGVASIAPM